MSEVDVIDKDVWIWDKIFEIITNPAYHTRDILISVLILIFFILSVVSYYAVRGFYTTRSKDIDLKRDKLKQESDQLENERSERALELADQREERRLERAGELEEKRQARADLIELRELNKSFIKQSVESVTSITAVNESVGRLADIVGQQGQGFSTQFDAVLNALKDVPSKINNGISSIILKDLTSELGSRLEQGCLVVDSKNKVVSYNTKGISMIFPDEVVKEGVVSDSTVLDVLQKSPGGVVEGNSMAIHKLLQKVRGGDCRQRTLLAICQEGKNKLVQASAHPFVDSGESADGLVLLTFLEFGTVVNREEQK